MSRSFKDADDGAKKLDQTLQKLIEDLKKIVELEKQAGLTGGSQAAGQAQGNAAVSGAANSIQSASPSKTMMEVGQDFTDGFVIGIQNGTPQAAVAANDMASTSVDSARNALEATSPSRKMIQLGEWFSEGLATGIHNKQNLVVKAAADLAKAAVDASHAQLATLNVTGTGGTQSGGAANPNTQNAAFSGQGGCPTVHVFIDGQEFRGMIKTEVATHDKDLRRAIAVQKRRG